MNYSGPEMAPWWWLGEAGDPLSLRAPCPARDFGTHTPCPSPASSFPLATGNATSCGDVAQPRQGSVPKGWGRPWVLPGCTAGAGARPCCGSCRCPRGPCCVTRVCLAPTSPGSARSSRSPGLPPRHRALLPAAGTTRHAACPPCAWSQAGHAAAAPLMGTPGWGYRGPQHASSHGTAPPCWGGAEEAPLGAADTPKPGRADTVPVQPCARTPGLVWAVPSLLPPVPLAPPRHHGSPRTPPAAGRGAAPLQQAALCAGAVARGGRTALPLCRAGEAAAGARGLRRAGSAPRSSGWEQGAPGGRYPRCGVGFGVGMRLGQ